MVVAIQWTTFELVIAQYSTSLRLGGLSIYDHHEQG